MHPSDNPGQILLIDKPLEWTSFDVVNKLRKTLGIKKIGHAGTLDPLATGLLIVCTGRMTKEVERFQQLEKEYTGTLILGVSTPSHDLETPVSETVNTDHLSTEEIRNATHLFTGRIEQRPPSFSAVKTGGKRAYELARKGRNPDLPPRPVEVKVFEITGIRVPAVEFKVVCSKGTYIRSLVRDFGNALKVGACLSRLCRTRIGPYRLEDAMTLDV